jgi:threonine dehydratase
MSPDLRPRIVETEEAIRGQIRRTPVVELAGEELGLDGGTVTLKLELLQHSGSFKARGAFANLALRPIPRAGVVAASGGNHGVAVAFAARRLGVPAKIFVPRICSPAKIDRIRAYGADLVVGGESYAEALVASEAWVLQSEAMPIHAFDQEETILGQGTLGLEQGPGARTGTVLVGVGEAVSSPDSAAGTDAASG